MEFPVGLSNIRNTCYINSVLQCILGLSDFCKEFVSLTLTDSLLVSLQKFIVYSYSVKKKVIIKPVSFLKNVFKTTSLFKIGIDGDANEFLLFLLDYIDTHSNSSIIKDYFYGTMERKSFCEGKDCGKTTTQKEQFNFININPMNLNTHNAYFNAFQEETLISKCQFCSKVTPKVIQTNVVIEPKVLILQVERHGDKLQKEIFINNNVSSRDFIGSIFYFGNGGGVGHYNYSGIVNKKLYNIDDSIVTESNHIGRNSYLITYGKLKKSNDMFV